MNKKQLEKMHSGKGFIAALDQSGGSTPKALKLYGINEDAYHSEEEMFDLVHQMRSRIITSSAFNGRRILGAILFEMTMDREVEGLPTADYLWEKKNVVPFLKIDKGLADLSAGVQLMKPNPGLDALLAKAVSKHIFGTKMRSVIKAANLEGIKQVVAQQFETAHKIVSYGLVPIIEPEVDIHIADKAEAEAMLLAEIKKHMGEFKDNDYIMFKLSLPSVPDFYKELECYPCVVRVVALSGGYSRDEANAILVQNHGMIASFSRALAEGLYAQQTDEQFDRTLDESIQSIYDASLS